MIPRPCIEVGCLRMARGGPRGSRCTPCQRAWDRERNARAGRAAYRDPVYRAVSVKGMRCVDCGTFEDVTKDHVIELHEGGGNAADNIEPRCRPCNAKKSNRIRRAK